MATDYISPWGGMPTGNTPLYGYSSVPDAVKKHFANYMSSGGMNVVYQDPETGLYWQAQNGLGDGETSGTGQEAYRVYKPSWDGGFDVGSGYDLFKGDGSYGGSEGFLKPSAQRTFNLGLGSVLGATALGALGAAGSQAGTAGGTAAADGAGTAGLSAADLASMEMGLSVPAGADAVAAYSGLASPSLEAMAGAMGMTPEAFTALGVGGVGAAGAAQGMTAGTAAAGGGGAGGGGWLDSLKNGAGKMAGSGGFNWTDLIGPATQLAGGYMGSQAAEKASDSQLEAAREAMALNEPFRQGGMKGMNRLLDVLGLSDNTGAAGYGSAAKDFSMADFQADPGYAFRQGEGEKALQRAASAGGLLGSGKYLKDSMRFNQDLASTEYGNAFNRFQTQRASKLNPLQSLMGAGQTSANTVADYRTQAGNAQAAGTVGSANAWTNALGQGYSMYANQRQQNQNNALMDRTLSSWGRY